MTWWDHETGSVWSQPIGEAIAGPLVGSTLELLPSTLTTWDSWTSAHPETMALDVEAWRTGFDLSDMAVVIDLGTEASAYAIPALREAGVVNDVVADVPIAVAIDPDDDRRWAVFSRQLNTSLVELTSSPEGLVDLATGSVFDPFTGVARSGPLSGESLDRLAAFTSFPEDYFTFFPAGRIWPATE